MRRFLKLLVLIVFVSATGLGVWAWLHDGGAQAAGLKTLTVERGSITEKAIAVGQIQPRQKFQVKSKIAGIVKRCHVEVGDRVEAGDPLFEIVPDPTPLELTEADRQVAAAQARFNRAQADYERVHELEDDGIVPRAEYEAIVEAYELARIELKQARESRQLTTRGRVQGDASRESVIRAPAAGTLLSRSVNPGDPVVPLTSYQPGTELATVADMGDLVFRGTVDEIDVGKLSLGLEARIKVGALPEQQVLGRLARIAPQAQKQDGATLFDVEIELEPSQVVLRAGYSANADLIILEKQDILLIPERLVSFEDDGELSYVELAGAGPETEPDRRQVELGVSDGLNVEVVSGLDEGDTLVERPPREIS